MTNAAAAELNLRGTSARLMVSVQVETAWGALQGTHVFEGIAQDRTDFPFLEALGLSSYPYLGGYATPADVPDNYYSRLVASQPLPVVVLEGGWPSVSIGGLISTPAVQAQYIRRQSELLDNSNAKGVFQITFTDLNPSPFPPGLSLFANLGWWIRCWYPNRRLPPGTASWRAPCTRRRKGEVSYTAFLPKTANCPKTRELVCLFVAFADS
jgi:hypothetical protein